MNPENIPYMARVNAAAWLGRNARKSARRLTDATPEQRLAIELEIVKIGMRLYSETRKQPQPEVTHDHHARAKSRYEFGDESERDAYVAGVVDQIAEATHDPGEDHELEAYVAAVRELVPGADRAVVQYWYDRRVPIQETAQRWLAFLAFIEQQRKGVNP